jgi:hypothetical protein
MPLECYPASRLSESFFLPVALSSPHSPKYHTNKSCIFVCGRGWLIAYYGIVFVGQSASGIAIKLHGGHWLAAWWWALQCQYSIGINLLWNQQIVCMFFSNTKSSWIHKQIICASLSLPLSPDDLFVDFSLSTFEESAKSSSHPWRKWPVSWASSGMLAFLQLCFPRMPELL